MNLEKINSTNWGDLRRLTYEDSRRYYYFLSEFTALQIQGKVRVNIYFRSWVMSFGINGCDWDKSDSREWLRANKNVPCAKTTLCQLKNCWVSLCMSCKMFCLLGDKSVTPPAQFGLTPPIHKLCYIEKPENNEDHLITRTFNFLLNYLIMGEWNH